MTTQQAARMATREASAYALRATAANPDTPPAIAQAAARIAQRYEAACTDRDGARIFQNCGRPEFARAAAALTAARPLAATPDQYAALTAASAEAARLSKV